MTTSKQPVWFPAPEPKQSPPCSRGKFDCLIHDDAWHDAVCLLCFLPKQQEAMQSQTNAVVTAGGNYDVKV